MVETNRNMDSQLFPSLLKLIDSYVIEVFGREVLFGVI
jgi:hypothetical protein